MGPSPTSALHSAFQRYEQPLIRYAMRYVRDPERARDVVQDTFVRLCESQVAPDDPRIGSWLFTVCRNRAIDVRRKDARLSTMEEPPEIPVETHGEDGHTVREVFAQVAELPRRKAEVLELRYRDGHSYRKIAQMTGMSVSHVGVVIHDCIVVLRKHLAVVAAFALLVGATTWGVLSAGAPEEDRSYYVQDKPKLPVRGDELEASVASPEPAASAPAASAAPRVDPNRKSFMPKPAASGIPMKPPGTTLPPKFRSNL